MECTTRTSCLGWKREPEWDIVGCTLPNWVYKWHSEVVGLDSVDTEGVGDVGKPRPLCVVRPKSTVENSGIGYTLSRRLSVSISLRQPHKDFLPLETSI